MLSIISTIIFAIFSLAMGYNMVMITFNNMRSYDNHGEKVKQDNKIRAKRILLFFLTMITIIVLLFVGSYLFK